MGGSSDLQPYQHFTRYICAHQV